MLLQKVWTKHKIRQLRARSHYLYSVGRFGKGADTAELADRMECELKGLVYRKPERKNPFLDDEGNLPSGFVPRGKVILRGDRPAVSKKFHVERKCDR